MGKELKDTYLRLYRSLMDNFLYDMEPYDKLHAWIDLLLRANFGDTTTSFNGQVQKTKRGQIRTSIGALADRWHWSEGKVRRYLKMLENEKMCSQNSTPNGTLLTIENYEKYQSQRQTDDSTDGRTDGRTGGTHNKNNKKNIQKNTSAVPSKYIFSSEEEEMEAWKNFTDEEKEEYYKLHGL